MLRPSWLDEDIGSNDPDSAATVVSRCSTNEEQEQVLVSMWFDLFFFMRILIQGWIGLVTVYCFSDYHTEVQL